MRIINFAKKNCNSILFILHTQYVIIENDTIYKKIYSQITLLHQSIKFIVIDDCPAGHFRVRWEKPRENRFSFGTQNITVKAARISASGGAEARGAIE